MLYLYTDNNNKKYIKMKSFEIKTKNNFLIKVLESAEPRIEEMVAKIEEAHNNDQHNSRKFDELDRVVTRYTLVRDFVRSIEIYTESNDQLDSIKFKNSHKGSFVVNAWVKRNEKLFSFETEVIYAGGHSVQRLHYRYITKTDLPKTNNIDVVNELNQKIKDLTKAEKLKQDVVSLERSIEGYKITIAEFQKITPDDVYSKAMLVDKDILTTSWEDVHAKGGYLLERFPTEKEFIDGKEKTKKQLMISHKGQLSYYKKNLKDSEKRLEKALSQIEELSK